MDALFPSCTSHRCFLSSLTLAGAIGLSLASPFALAQQTRSIYQEQGELVRGSKAVKTLGNELFGDKVSLYTGSLEFVQTDVSLPGNSALPVAVGRRLIAGGQGPGNGHFGKWDLEIPHLHGVFANAWTSATGAAPQQRCTNFGQPVPAWDMNHQSTWSGDEYWNGTFLYVPGMGDQELLRRSSPNALAPADGQSYPVVTRNHWQFRCLAGLANDPNAAKPMGQGFVAVSPEGTVYQFDQMVSRPTSYLDKPVPVIPGTESTAPSLQMQSVMVGAPPPTTDQYYDLRLRRSEYWMLPTRITDRFGNVVIYTYDSTDPWKLLSISSSDAAGSPRTLSFTYVTGTRQIATVTDGSRTWTYNYSGSGINTVLTSVTLPDASSWQLWGIDALMADFQYSSEGPPSCDSGGALADVERTGTMTHPSGAIGTFTLRPKMHARSGVWRTCQTVGSGERSYYANFFANHALMAKTLSGPGIGTLTWSNTYAEPQMSWDPCNGCVASTTTEVTDPGGAKTRYTFGTLFRQTEGQLQQVEVFDANGALLRTTATQYQDPASGPWPSPVGYSDQRRGDGEFGALPEIVKQRTISQQGVDFKWTANWFDGRGRPVNVTKSSTLGATRSETTLYWDQTTKWILGQVTSVTESTTGISMEANTYDGNTGAHTSVSHFGHPDGTMTYNADGTLATRTDGRNYTTNFWNYKRGLAQNASYPDGGTESASVNNYGAVTSTTNPYGNTTNYGYDAMGRLSSVTLPGGDPVTWNTTTISFQQVQSTELDLDPAHWRQDITTGNARKSTYFDALWRPVYSYTADLGNPGATSRMTKNGYDFAGRTTFASYPERSYPSSFKGVTTTYDGLGRTVQTSAESDSAPLITTTSYGSGFQTTFTDALNHSTVTSYQAFDQPVDAVSHITAPENVDVAISRDLFGKTTAITRSGGGKSATRSYVYDGYQRLCKTIEPETGATVQDYDAANNVAWRASGLSLPGGGCDTGSVPANTKIAFSYDPMNRLGTTTYSDGAAAIYRTYTLDGLPLTISSNGSVWTNTYNKRRLNTLESLAYGGATYNIGRAYDVNGSLSQLTYPDGSAVAYSPNALGEPQQVGGYASSITYHPSGAVAGFQYGNGIQHSLTQHVRGLPWVSTDTGVLNDSYSYDNNGNVTAITDNLTATSRTMGYDNLDRLTSVAAPALWGTATYSYDSLDNLTGNTITGNVTPARSVAFNYPDPTTNRLMSTSGSAGYNYPYAYDAQGNITQRDGKQYIFDQGNRMTSSPGVATYGYDGLGHRVSVVGTDGVNRIQIYSQGGQMLQAGAAGAATRYIYLHNHVIAEVGPGGTQYQHTDGLGSPVARTNTTGILVSFTKYEPYGKTAAGVMPSLGFTGHVNDADTGLVYMQQRYYDPVAGRFLSVDPVTTDASTGASFNRYTYAANSPYKYIDPDGRQERAAEALSERMRVDIQAGNSNVNRPLVPLALAIAAAPVAVTVGAAVVVAGPAIAAGGTAAAKLLGSVGRAGEIGKNIIKWGTKQTPEAVAQTVARTEQITPRVVDVMKDQGLTKAWVEKQATQYGNAIETGGTKLNNTQLQPRYELMQKILENWSDPTYLH